MPGGFPLGIGVCNGTSAGVSAGLGTTITSNGSANTKGSWTQLVASTSSDTCWVLINTLSKTWAAAGYGVAVDIGVGSSGNEIVLIPNVLTASDDATYNISTSVGFPVSIPSGTRISARCQDSVGGEVCYVNLIMFDGALSQMEGAAGVDAIGFNSAATVGTVVTPGAASAKGSYSQLSAATARDYIGLFAMFDMQTNSSYPEFAYDIDLAIGASGSEQIIIPDYCGGNHEGYTIDIDPIPFIPISIPSGTRIAARCANSGGSTIGIGMTVYGVYQ